MTTLKQIGLSFGISAIMTGTLYACGQMNADPVASVLLASVLGGALLMYSLNK